MSKDRKEMSAFGRGPGVFGGPGGPGGAFMPTQKAKNFKGTLFRLVGYFRPYRFRLLIVFVAAILGTIFSILSPYILGNVTTDLFEGYLLKIKGVPGGGVNFAQILHLLILLGGLYVFSSIFSYVQQYVMAGVAQTAVYDLRKTGNG